MKQSAQQQPVHIRVQNVSKTFKLGREIIPAVQDVTLDIHTGDFVAILGPSGSGKTTLIQLLGGLSSPTKGTITVDGRRVRLGSDKEASVYRNTKVGFVFQNYALLPKLTVLENITLPLMLANMRRRKRKKIAQQYLDMLGLSELGKHKANQLSGGQRQRVGIARALVHKPSILIADEPTGNLDSARGAEVLRVFSALNKQHGITIILVTHDESIASIAHRIIRMKDGRITEDSYEN